MSAHPASGPISIHVVDGRLVTGENPTNTVLLSAKGLRLPCPSRCDGTCVEHLSWLDDIHELYWQVSTWWSKSLLVRFNRPVFDPASPPQSLANVKGNERAGR